MEDYQTGEETAFVVDEVSTIVKEAVEGAIGENSYQQSRVKQWTNNVVEQCLSQLNKLGKPFKYIVTCIIMQKNGAGLQTACSCFWDNTTDGTPDTTLLGYFIYKMYLKNLLVQKKRLMYLFY
uniref:Dynein, light chain, Tctex-type 1 n=1 Tax=Astyanax mexicanus TaxID=7994 RepID=A0A8B9GW45_ASTMX